MTTEAPQPSLITPNTAAPSTVPVSADQKQTNREQSPSSTTPTLSKDSAQQTSPLITPLNTQGNKKSTPTLSAIRTKAMAELAKFYQKPVAKVSTEVFATILTVILLAVFAIRPMLVTMSQLLKDIEDRKVTDKALTEKIAALSTASTEVISLRRELVLLDTALPNVSDPDGILKRIEKLASEQGIIISSLTVGNIPDETGAATTQDLTSLAVSLSLKADYAKTRAFVQALPTVDRQMKVVLVSMILNQEKEIERSGQAPETAGPPELQTTITIQPYYYGIAPKQKDAGK